MEANKAGRQMVGRPTQRRANVAGVFFHASYLMTEYERFITGKKRENKPYGFDVDISSLNLMAKDWQRLAVKWAVKRGRAALFEECGLGKTLQQLMWAEQIVLRENESVVVVCPVGVRQQTIGESSKFGIKAKVAIANDQSDISGSGIYVTNYEKLHKFDCSKFVGIVLDESSCIKEFKSKTRRDLCTLFADTPYRLACTATPSPNEYMELGNHAEFLGIMPSNEMLSRWFINDTMRAGEYKLLGHAENDFWRWVCGWAMCLSKPSDMGDEFSDDGYLLPEIDYIFEQVDSPMDVVPGQLFPIDAITVQTMHREKRQSCEDRAKRVAEIVATDPNDYWVIWCDTDYEADQLSELIPDAIEVRGSMPEKRKESLLKEFSEGKVKKIITKPEIAGFGLNWQHSCNTVFVGVSYSFERFYQAVRRLWRFGQTRKVRVWIVEGVAESAISARVFKKANAHKKMQESMAGAMRGHQIAILQGDKELSKYQPKKTMRMPEWLLQKKSKRELLGNSRDEIGICTTATVAM